MNNKNPLCRMCWVGRFGRIGWLTIFTLLATACSGTLEPFLDIGEAPSAEQPAADSPAPPQSVLQRPPPPEKPYTTQQKVSFDRGVAALRDGNGVVAVEVFSNLAQQLPRLAAPQANLGSAYMLRGDPSNAVKAYRRAIELDPQLATAHVRLGVLYRRADRLEDAEAAYLAALNADPQNRLAHLNIGILYDIYLRKPAQALEHYQRFQTLSGQPDKEVGLWIADLKQRL